MDAVKIGKLIAKLRREKGLTQEDLGDILGFSDKTVSKWECGRGLPDVTVLKKISEILGISIEDLLNGEIDLPKKHIGNNRFLNELNFSNFSKREKLISILILIIIILIISLMIVFILKKNDGSDESNNNCTVIRTYYIDSVGRSNDENYLYITVHEFQVEGTFTLKLPKLISGNLEVGKSYQFTFKTRHDYLRVNTDVLFDNSEVINLEYSDKEGLDRVSTFYCD